MCREEERKDEGKGEVVGGMVKEGRKDVKETTIIYKEKENGGKGHVK